MRTFDLAPLYRSTVGFDRLFSMLDGTVESAPTYPPYNIERTGDNAYRISVAVAGFGENELSIEAKENTLTIDQLIKTKIAKLGENITVSRFVRFKVGDTVSADTTGSETPSAE